MIEFLYAALGVLVILFTVSVIIFWKFFQVFKVYFEEILYGRNKDND
jgi:hypothetical protein